MHSRRPSPEHQEAVSRRLAQLSAELAVVRGDPPAPEAEGEPEREPERETEAPRVPVPGRHAARRRARLPVWSDLLQSTVPASMRGRVALAPVHVTVVAVIVACGLAISCWWVVRSDPSGEVAPGIASAPPLVESLTPAASLPAGSASASPSSTVTVDVAGKVRRPGIAVLSSGARVVDALEAAGGARPGVDLAALNLARVLVDGEQILVGMPAPVGSAASAVPSPGSPAGPLVNLNTAGQTELEALPEVGPVTAQAIIAWRTEHGGFTSVDELLEVDGIGEATLGTIAPYVTV